MSARRFHPEDDDASPIEVALVVVVLALSGLLVLLLWTEPERSIVDDFAAPRFACAPGDTGCPRPYAPTGTP